MRLHLCSGARIEPGWINLDMDPPAEVRHDVRAGLPFPDEHFSHIYSEHAIEHFTSQQGVALLRECKRVLKPGGALRLSTPDLRCLAALYQQACKLADTGLDAFGTQIQSNPLRFYEKVGFIAMTPAQLINQGMRDWGHLHLYDEFELSLALSVAGFRHARRQTYQRTDVPDMIVEGRPDCNELIMEAVR